VRAGLRRRQLLPELRRAGDCAPYLVVLLLVAWQKVCAQLAPADDFFNGGAQFYISNNVPAALERVENGLKLYPDDEKLKKLEQLLKQQQQQNQQQQNQQNQQQQNQQSSQQNSQDQQKQDQQKQNQSDQQKADQQKQQEQQQAAAQKKEGEKKDKPDTEAQPVKEGRLTPEEAKRLLDAQKGDEQLLQYKPPEKPRNPLRPVKDW
jgi:Ca-activated chloride channel family protein